jgi:hypothetical protein
MKCLSDLFSDRLNADGADVLCMMAEAGPSTYSGSSARRAPRGDLAGESALR